MASFWWNLDLDLYTSIGPGVQSDITSTNLYRGYNVMDSPFIVNVQPAGTCAAKSIAIPNQAGAGHSLELSTAGLQADFTITVWIALYVSVSRLGDIAWLIFNTRF
jgi:hypothetical protein